MEPLKIWHAPVQGYARDRRRPAGQAHEVVGDGAGRRRTGAPLTLVNHPVLYDGEAAEVRLPPQQLGAQTEEVLTEIGLSAGRDRCARRRPRSSSSRG